MIIRLDKSRVQSVARLRKLAHREGGRVLLGETRSPHTSIFRFGTTICSIAAPTHVGERTVA